MANTIEAVASCGCCFSSSHKCRLHDAPIIMLGKTHSRKVKSEQSSFALYRSKLNSFIDLNDIPDNVVVENPTQFACRQLMATTESLIVIGRLPSLFKNDFNVIGSLGRYTVYIYLNPEGVMSSFEFSGISEFCKAVAGYSWLNCSVGEFFLYAEDTVHTPFLNIYKYYSSESFRASVTGDLKSNLPEGLYS